MSGIGHNGGPAMEGHRWRRTCWTHARAALLPHLPLNVLRRRVRRAAELGLDYPTYATVRAGTGRDIIGILFSSNALGVLRDGQGLPEGVAARLATLERVSRIGLAGRALPEEAPLDAVHAAPVPMAPFAAQRSAVLAALAPMRLPSDGVLLIGGAPWEKDWCAAGRLAGHLDGARFFASAQSV